MTVADRQKPPPGDLYLDHVSHFVPDLDAAAAVLEGLGLRVTPASIQMVKGKPAGTSNRCAMLEEGYIELLAPRPDRGLRLACFGTPDAEAEYRRLADHGFEPPPIVDLSRKVDYGAEVRFKVVRTNDKMPEGRIQFVQQLTPAVIWREPFLNPFRLISIFVIAEDPVAAAARWARFAALLPRRTDEGIRLDTARGAVIIGERFPWRTPPAPALAGYGLACGHPDVFAARCSASGLVVRKDTHYSVELPQALGGAWVFG